MRVSIQFDSSVSEADYQTIINTIDRIHAIDTGTYTPDGFITCMLVEGGGYEEFLDSLLQVDGINLAEPVYFYESGDRVWLTDEILVSFQTDLTTDEIEQIAIDYDVQLVGLVSATINLYSVRNTNSSGMGIVYLANTFHNLQVTRYAHPDFYVRLNQDGNYRLYDYYHYLQPHVKHVIGNFDSGPTVWDFAGLENFVTVAVLDDGIDAHEDLPQSRILSGYDFRDNDPDARPGQFQAHGMGCAGLIAASHTPDSTQSNESTTGMISMNPNVNIIPIKIFGDDPNNDSSGITLSNLCAAIDSSWKWGADILSNSWSFRNPYQPQIPGINDILDTAHTLGRNGLGCPIIFSSGNFGEEYPSILAYPSYLECCFAVGATRLSDSLWYYSCWGPQLDIAAPSGQINNGGDVFTLDQMGIFGFNWLTNCGEYNYQSCWETCPSDEHPNDGYNCYFGGTSAACPLVSGAASLLLARNSSLTAEEVYYVLKESAVPVLGIDTCTYLGKLNPADSLEWEWGRLDAYRAMLAIVRGDANNDGIINNSDQVYLINWIFKNGPEPEPDVRTADADCDGNFNLGDAVYVINYVFKSGPAPPICFEYDY